MVEAVLSVEGLGVRFGGLKAVDQLSLTLESGELHALIGPNGAGKTVTLSTLAGEFTPQTGCVRLAGRDVTHLSTPARTRAGIARSFQITSLCLEFTAIDNVSLAIQAHQGHSFRFWKRARSEPSICEPALKLLDRVGLGSRALVPAGLMAHGEQRQLEVAIALASDPRVLLLDEPMAGMGAEESRDMVTLLKTLKRRYTILLVEHDMDAVFGIADRISVMVYGRRIATGPPSVIRRDADVRRAYLGEEQVEVGVEGSES